MITFVHYKQWVDLQELKNPTRKRLTAQQQKNLENYEKQQQLHEQLTIGANDR
jgi:hypothetical protein